MTSTKLLIVQILIVFAIMCAEVWPRRNGALRCSAQQQLGSPWFILGSGRFTRHG
jgi:hypothetical protein